MLYPKWCYEEGSALETLGSWHSSVEHFNPPNKPIIPLALHTNKDINNLKNMIHLTKSIVNTSFHYGNKLKRRKK